MVMAVKVLALDATPEEQKQIKSELEILHKVGPGNVGGNTRFYAFHVFSLLSASFPLPLHYNGRGYIPVFFLIV